MNQDQPGPCPSDLIGAVPPLDSSSFRSRYDEHFARTLDPDDDTPRTRRLRAVKAMIEEGRLPPWAFLPPRDDEQSERHRTLSDKARDAFLEYARHREIVNAHAGTTTSGSILAGCGVSTVRRQVQEGLATQIDLNVAAATESLAEAVSTGDEQMVGLARQLLSAMHAVCPDGAQWNPRYSIIDAVTCDHLHAAWIDAAELAYRARWQLGWPGEGPAPGCPADSWSPRQRVQMLTIATL